MPHLKHYGDVSKMNGSEIETMDIITFGSESRKIFRKHDEVNHVSIPASGIIFIKEEALCPPHSRVTHPHPPLFFAPSPQSSVICRSS